MVLFALSFQDQVEKYGAYVGIAAFFGLAVLSLLYFSQARELKRLREWAERAPDRARELEQRAVSQATASVRRVPAAATGQGAIAPPRRLAEMPAPASAAGAAAAASGTEVAEAVESDPATNGNVPKPPFGPGGTVPAGPLPADEAAASANGGPAGHEGAVAAPETDGQPAPAGEETERDEVAAAPGGVAAGTGSVPGRAAAAAGAAGAGAAPAEPSSPADRAGTPVDPDATQPGGFPAVEDDTPAPGEVPAAAEVPRATPAQRIASRPQALPLRQAKPSATPSGGGRRPGAPAARKPAGAKPPREGRSAGTIALFVGLAVLILGGGAFLGSQLLAGEDEPTPPNRAAPPPTETADSTEGGSNGGGGGAEAPPKAETNVGVLNGTTFPGLAGQLADQVATEGYERGVTETNIRDQTIQESIVYYADGFRASARAVGRLFSIDQFEPLDSETASLAPGADVVVLAGADQTP